MISKDDFDQWAASAVTKAVVGRIAEIRALAIDSILSIEPTASTDIYAMNVASLRSFISGLEQATDIDSLRFDLVGGDNE